MNAKAEHHREDNGIIRQTSEKAKEVLTLLWNEIPAWMQDNHYIHRGYRHPSNSYRTSAASLGYLHNESVNIWTHLIGALLAISAATVLHYFIRPRFQMANSEDVMVFSCFFLGAVGCLGMSATYHTISNHSESVAKFGNRLDYVGIVFLIWGSFVPSIFYGFSAEPALMKTYWTMFVNQWVNPSDVRRQVLTLLLILFRITTIGAGTAVAIFYPKFRSPEWRPLRASMFVAMGLSAVVPVLHGVRIYGLKQLEDQMGLSYVVSQGILYIAGASIYAARIPEKWRPGAFDIWGSSHQIFHVLVVLAATVHLVGLFKAFDHEHSFRSGVISSYSKIRELGDR